MQQCTKKKVFVTISGINFASKIFLFPFQFLKSTIISNGGLDKKNR